MKTSQFGACGPYRQCETPPPTPRLRYLRLPRRITRMLSDHWCREATVVFLQSNRCLTGNVAGRRQAGDDNGPSNRRFNECVGDRRGRMKIAVNGARLKHQIASSRPARPRLSLQNTEVIRRCRSVTFHFHRRFLPSLHSSSRCRLVCYVN